MTAGGPVVRASGKLVGPVLLSLSFAACAHDFDSFEVVPDGSGGRFGAGGTWSGSGGVTTGGAAGSGGTPAAGTAGAADASLGGGAPFEAGAEAGDGAPPDSGRGGALGTEAGPPEAGACASGMKLCGAACVRTTDPTRGCAGPSCDPCSVPNAATTLCVAGACAPDRCNVGWGDCNATPGDGCERAIVDDVANCGACDRACSAAQVGSLACGGRQCAPYCQLGWGNCQRPPAGADDGCETDTRSNNPHCGGCGNSCAAQDLACFDGLCGCASDGQCRGPGAGTATCDTGSRLCSCAVAATCVRGEICRATGCSCNGGAACAAGETCCETPRGCLNLSTDPASCGGCGRACLPGFACVGGACQCDGNDDCNAGSAGTCSAGSCTCGVARCTEGQRCLAGSQCG